MIPRLTYLTRLEQVRDKQIIKVLTGVRRAGKSTILTMYQAWLKEHGVHPNQIQAINFEDLAFSELKDYEKLYAHLNTRLVPDQMNYLFLDEIQNVPQFEKVIDSLFIKPNVDLYITGSNAFLLSGELATLLTGRYLEIPVFPLSFAEIYQNDANPHQAFETYLTRGGFPFALDLTDETSYQSYIDGIINTVLIKDILARRERGNATLLRHLAQFLVDTAGNLVNPNKIAGYLTSKGLRTSAVTINSYLTSLTEAFLFYQCNRYDLNGKKYLTTNAKYYPVDPALRQALLGSRRPNLGSRLETIVYLELKRRGYQILVGTLGAKEIDFIATKNGVREYYQVSQTVQDEATYQREVRGFEEINDNYRKILLTMDAGHYNDQGIEQLNVVDWLLDKEGAY